MSEISIPEVGARRAPLGVPLRVASEDRLARLAARGDARAFGEIYRRHHQELYRYCRSLLHTDEDAQDALQNTMAAALRGLTGEERAIALKPWLYRVAHNEAITLARRRKPEVELSEADAVAISDDPATRGRLRELFEDLRELPEKQRGALVMRELSGLGYDEIGTAFGITAAAATQAVFDARRGLLELSEGRAMACDDVQIVLSAGDRRSLRARRMRSHLRSCAICRDFQISLVQRPRDLAALAPALPASLAASLLHSLLGGGGGGSGGGGIGGGLSAGLKAGSASLGIKSAAVAAIVATAGSGAVIEMRAPDARPSEPRQAVARAVTPRTSSRPAALPALQPIERVSRQKPVATAAAPTHHARAASVRSATQLAALPTTGNDNGGPVTPLTPLSETAQAPAAGETYSGADTGAGTTTVAADDPPARTASPTGDEAPDAPAPSGDPTEVPPPAIPEPTPAPTGTADDTTPAADGNAGKKDDKADKGDKVPKEPKPPKEPKDPEPPKEPKDPKEPKPPKDDKAPKEPKNDKGGKETGGKNDAPAADPVAQAPDDDSSE